MMSFLLLLGPIISRLFTCSNAERIKKMKGACSSPISMAPCLIKRMMYLTAWSSITHKVCHYLKNTVLIFIPDTVHWYNVWVHCLHMYAQPFFQIEDSNLGKGLACPWYWRHDIEQAWHSVEWHIVELGGIYLDFCSENSVWLGLRCYISGCKLFTSRIDKYWPLSQIFSSF